MAIKSRYRIKNSKGAYDTIHLETTAEQVITTDSRQFVTKEEKATIASSKSYVHNQGVSSNSWQINHGLGRIPSVTVIDSSGTMIIGNVTYIDTNSIRIDFSAAISGKAYLN